MTTAQHAEAINWHRQTWRIAGPIILSNISIPLLGAVDTAVMGHLPDPAFLGATAVGAMIMNFVYWGFSFLRMGTTGFAAQAQGAGDANELRSTLARALLAAAALAGLALVAQIPILAVAVALVDASDRVSGLVETYFLIRIWGAPAALVTYVMIGWLLGTQDARSVLVIQLVLNSLNIALDLLFVIGLGWGIEGVAAATVISEFVAVGVGAVIVTARLRRFGGAWDRRQILDRARLIALLRVNRDIFIRTICVLLAFAIFTTQSARFGDLILAGNAVLLQFETFAAYALDGYAHAAEVMAGTAVGARNRGTFRAAVQVGMMWAGGTALVLSVGFWIGGDLLIAVLTDIEDVRAIARTYLPWVIVMPIVAVGAYQFDGIFAGATRTAAMRNAMLASLLFYVGCLVVLMPWFGNHGLWLSLTLFLAIRGVTLALCYPSLERSVAPA